MFLNKKQFQRLWQSSSMTVAIIFLLNIIATLKWGKGGLPENFAQLHLEISFHVSIPNFNVTDCIKNAERS